MPVLPAFEAAYGKLNSAQRIAVDTIDGPVMVIAGPGTGKTQVLATRIAQILLTTDTNPRAVLALTFTESAAQNMRERLVQLIGKTGYYVQISTFHAFCSDIIQRHPEYFPIERGSEPLSDLERYGLFEKILQELQLEVLKPLNQPLFYLREVIKAISDLKREGVTPERLEEIIEEEALDLENPEATEDSKSKPLSKTEQARLERQQAKHRELLVVYQEYQRRMRDLLRYDYDDMISLVVSAFKTEELLLNEYQENIHYFLIDEYQDTNTAQNQVVDLLASYWGEQANVFVVGDPNQAIYRFQGASIENTLGFAQRYPQAQIINLEIGYRCPPAIYEAAARLISHNNLKLETSALKSHKENEFPLGLLMAPSETIELVAVAEEIKKLIDQGVAASDIAILYRHNRDAAAVREVLTTWNINYEIDGGNNILSTESICQLLRLFEVIDTLHTKDESEYIFEVMTYDWISVNNLLAMKVARASAKANLSIVDLIQRGHATFQKYYGGTDVSPLEFSTLEAFVEQLTNWKVADSQFPFPLWFEQVIEESGYLPYILNHPQKPELVVNINSLFREIRTLSGQQRNFKLHQFLEVINTLLKYEIAIQAEDLNIQTDAVSLSTVHRAKGREWKHVYIIHAWDGKWGNAKKRELLPLPDGVLRYTDVSAKEDNEDERRLLYVAITRAKDCVTICYPDTQISGNRSKQLSPTMFLEELVDDKGQSLLSQVEIENVTAKADEHLARLLQPIKAKKLITEAERAFFAALVKDFKLSVTALNLYLRDPQEFVLNVLLQVPRTKPEPMAFGSAIHRALEVLYKEIQASNRPPQLEVIHRVYRQALERELLTSLDFDRRLKFGQDILTQYYQALPAEAPRILEIEKFFGSGSQRVMLNDIPLTGRIDRIDWINIKEKTVRVIDYKTGKPKTDGYIEGTLASLELSEREQQLPDSIRGPYKRQLLFYKLIAELDPHFLPTVVEGIFEFVEPNERGKLVSRNYELKQSDVDDLKKLIIEVMTEIRELKFLDAV